MSEQPTSERDFEAGDLVEVCFTHYGGELNGRVGTVERPAPDGTLWVRLDDPPPGWCASVLFDATELLPARDGVSG